MNERLYFDCNAMFGPWPKKHREARWTKAHLLEDLDLTGIAGALVFHTQCLHGDPMRANYTLIEEIREHRDRLFPCWVAFPGDSGDFPPVPTFMSELKKHDVRAVRIDPGNFGIFAKESVWAELRDALLSENVLAVISVNRLASDLTHIDEILDIFRQNQVLLLNHGWGQWRAIHHFMSKYPNLHLDFSSFQANRAIEYFTEKFGAERCLFGTSLMAKAPGAARGFLDWTLLGEGQAALVAGGNLKRLLGGAGPTAIPAPGKWADALTAAARAGQPLPCEIWDNHCHILHDGSSAPGGRVVFHKGDADGMIELIRRVGIDKTAIMSWAGPLSMDTELGNETVARAVARYPEEFIGLATVNPEHQSEEEIAAVIQKYHVELGFPGLKTLSGCQNLNYDDPLFDKWFTFANEHHLYAVIDPCGALDSEMIDHLSKKFPNMVISLDHCGQSWEYAKWAAEMVNKYPAVFAQLNFTNVTNGTIEYLVEHCGADRVLFGTDAPMRDPRPQVGWLVFTRLPEAAKRKIFGENFARTLSRVKLGK